jgi:hypothetical protein
MGCDISIYIEEKIDNVWQEVEISPGEILPEDRYYKCWGFLFDVRNEPEWGFKNPSFVRRGLPEDCINKGLREDYENTYSDWHSWSYITSEEIEGIEWPEELKECYFRVFLEYILPRCQTWVCRETRMIVCFHC